MTLTNEILLLLPGAGEEAKQGALRALRATVSAVAAEPFLTVDELATALRCNPSTLYRKNIKRFSHNLMGLLRYRLSEVVAGLEKTEGAEDA